MSIEEFRSKNTVDLHQEIYILRKIQFGLRMQKSRQQLINTGQLRAVRRDIARVYTVLTEKACK